MLIAGKEDMNNHSIIQHGCKTTFKYKWTYAFTETSWTCVTMATFAKHGCLIQVS